MIFLKNTENSKLAFFIFVAFFASTHNIYRNVDVDDSKQIQGLKNIL